MKLKDKIYLFNFCLLFLACLASCKKEVSPALPGDKAGTSLNFYSASDVTAAYAKSNQLTAIYIDQFNPKLPLSGNFGVPVFSYGNGTASESPLLAGEVFSFLRYDAGEHQLMFTDTTNSVVIDTTLNLQAETFNCFYLTDAPASANALASYKVVAVKEDRANVPVDKTGIRFIHLSADAGDLTVNLQKPDRTLAPVLPAKLSFLQASPYQYLDASAVVSGLLRFTLTNAPSGASIITAVPFYPGHSYVVVISGFLDDQQRQIPAGKNLDGSRKYTSITITKNLRATVRRSY